MPIARHPNRVMDWCMSEDEKKETEKMWGQTILYAEIKNELIKEDVEIWSKTDYNQRVLWTKTNN